MGPKFHSRWIGMVAMAVMCWAVRASAQAQVGDDLKLNMGGSVSVGYSGSYTNDGPSSHGLSYGGNGTLSGSYYSPSFLSFTASPFYNQSSSNSSYQSISDSSGITATANIFAGSHFPGYVNFSRINNSEGDYLLPGLPNYKTNGNSQTFGVGWSANLPDLPSVSAGYQQGNNDYSVYGANTDSFTSFHSVFGSATYKIAGFHLNGGIHYSEIDSKFPMLMANETAQQTSSNTTSFTLNMSRNLWDHGTTWATFSRNDYGSNSMGWKDSQTADLLTGGASWKPTRKLDLQFTGDYNDNLAGTLFQTIAASGGVVPESLPGESSHAWGLFGQVQYSLLTGLYVSGNVSHRQQFFLGNSYDSTALGGSANYGHALLGGQFTAGISISRNEISNAGEAMLGLLSHVTYVRQFGLWSVSGSFNYAQNVQTFLINYTTSSYGYSGNVSRRFGRINWNGSASGSKSLLTNVAGTNTYSQTYSTGLSGRWLGASAGYSKATGIGLYTGTGITSVPTGQIPGVGSTPVVFYGGTTYSFGLGSTPIRGLTISATFSRTRSNTLDTAGSSNNISEQGNAYVQYLFRKVYFTSGYSRLLQGFSATGLPPTMVASYYFGVSRWFNFF